MRITIIGGGMAGLTAAIQCARKGHNVTLLEANSRVGKKISQTGNGRCNIMNCNINAEAYNGDICLNVLEYRKKVEEFLNSIGLVLSKPDREGRVYPFTENANSVVDCLRLTCENEGVNVLCSQTATEIEKRNGGYIVTTQDNKYTADKVIVAIGSRILNKSFSSNMLAGKYLTKLVPSLVPIKTDKPLKYLNGIKTQAVLTLLADNKPIKSERGEVLFKEYGISGIAVFNLSAEIARDAVKNIKRRYRILLDLFAELTIEELVALLKNRLKQNRGAEYFYGLLHNKLAQAVMERLEINTVNNKNIDKIAYLLKNFDFNVTGLLDESMAQVMAGGIEQKFLNENMQIKENGVYCCGEILNVDGVCGGFNLFFAMASAIAIAEKL